jgi:hypothetical protein
MRQAQALCVAVIAQVVSAVPTLVARQDTTTAADPAATADPGNVLVILPPTGGGSNEDCGAGPLTFNRGTWTGKGMDDEVKNFYAGLQSQGSAFDFHHAWADKYGSGLYCRLASENCENGVGVCSSLKGSTADKEKGLLGLTAISNAQSIFVAMDQAITAAANNLVGKLNDFSDVS